MVRFPRTQKVLFPANSYIWTSGSFQSAVGRSEGQQTPRHCKTGRNCKTWQQSSDSRGWQAFGMVWLTPLSRLPAEQCRAPRRRAQPAGLFSCQQDTSAGSHCQELRRRKAPVDVQCLALSSLHLHSHPASLESLSGTLRRQHGTDWFCSLNTRCCEDPNGSFSSFLPKGWLYSP